MTTQHDERSAGDEPAAPGRYDLTRLHSSGGLGRVWLAVDQQIGREVALKELLAEQAENPVSRARFMREARITGQLEHPNIVPVYEVGESGDGGRPYYAMRFVRGITLREAIADEFGAEAPERWPRRRRRLLRALIAIANAIGHAHSRGIVHRDLKPENIVLGEFGELILLDWGLAKSLDDPFDSRADDDGEEELARAGLLETCSGSVLGTIAYMSPEQAAGEPADERTDIYGLGSILFEILTGQPPHGGDDVRQVLHRIATGKAPRARSVRPDVPPGLDAICARAMATRPEDRYGSAQEVIDELERWLADEPVHVLPDTPLRALARWVRRHQSVAFTAALALLAVGVVSTLAAVWLNASAARERGLRERSLRSSAELAALSVGREITLRWFVLESSARDPELRRLLGRDVGDDAELRTWVQEHAEENERRAPALSWIVMDRDGIQRARYPHDDSSVGRSFAFRDYFHGQDQDFPEGTTGLDPIRAPHRSVVFRSSVTGNLMVAFSVPIRSGPRGERGIVGVLGMTVELGGFGFEEMQLDETQMVVLVDTAEHAGGGEGRILQHARLARERLQRGATPASAPSAEHLSPERLAQLRDLRERKLASVRADRAGDASEGRSAPRLGYETLLDSDYRDPLYGPDGGRWLAAFEPVLVKGRRGRVTDTGWVVIVQERIDAD